MAENKVQLVLDVDTDPAEREIKGLEKTVDKSAKAMDADIKKVEKSTKKIGGAAKESKRSWLDAGAAGSKAAGLAGGAFAGLSGGIGVATASAENMETAMIGAGSAIASGFAAGGPAGAAIAAAGVGIGVIVKNWQEAERWTEEAAAQVAEYAKQVATAEQAATGWVDRFLESELIAERTAIAMFRFAGATDSSVQKVVLLERETAKMKDAVRESRAEAARLFEEVERTAKLGEDGRIENEKAIKIWREQGDLADRLAETLGRVQGIRDAALATAREEAEAAKGTAAAVKNTTGEYSAAIGPLEAIVDLSVLNLEAWERQQNALAKSNKDLLRQVQILEEADRYEKERLRVEQQRQDLIAQGLDATLVERKAAAELADIQKRQTEELERQAKSKEKGAKATEKEAAAVKSAASAVKSAKGTSVSGFSDVTKGFQSIGGGGLFGFGAAPKGPRSFFSQPQYRIPANVKKTADSTKTATAEQKKLAPAVKEMADTAAKNAKAAAEVVSDIANAVDEFVKDSNEYHAELGQAGVLTSGWKFHA